MNVEEIVDLIAESACEVLPSLDQHQFVQTDRLADLGANSVDRAEIAMIVMEKLSLKIPRTEMFGPDNIGELAELLQRKMLA